MNLPFLNKKANASSADPARAYGDDFGYLRLLFGGSGENDPGCCFVFCFDELYYDSVGKRFDCHDIFLRFFISFFGDLALGTAEC